MKSFDLLIKVTSTWRRYHCGDSARFSFNELPSPPSYPLIGCSHLFFKNGPYSKEKCSEAFTDLSQKYGPIFLLKFPGQRMVITTDAENAFKVFQTEGKYPVRIGMSALEHYHKKKFNAVGVIPGNGESWYKLRKCLIPLLTKKYIAQFNPMTERIAQSFVNYIRNHRNENHILFDICYHLYKYSVECISIVSPGKRLHCLDAGDDTNSKIINASCEFMDGLYKTFSEPPFWKIIKTNGYKQFENGYDILTEYIDSEIKKPINEWENSFMKNLFENSNLSQNEARLLAIEVFLSGIDAVASTIALTLHYLSKDEARQDLAFKDILQGSQSYLRACLKETLRLSPTAAGTSRILPVDLVMNGYLIPANTMVLVLHSATSTMEKYFEDASSYKPERWLRKTGPEDPYSSYASLPFGFGARVCPGRWLSEQESLHLLTEVLKEFKLLSATDSPVGMVHRMNRIPERPIHVRFVDRVKS